MKWRRIMRKQLIECEKCCLLNHYLRKSCIFAARKKKNRINMKQIIITALLALVAVAGQAQKKEVVNVKP